MIERIEDSLNGGYQGLYGEVVTHDSYRLQKVPFVPDIVFDIGANVGVFSRYAHSLWPEAKVVGLEPHPENCEIYRKFTNGNFFTLEEKALGTGGGVYQATHKEVNGAHQNYRTASVGYPIEELEGDVTWSPVKIPSMTLGDLIMSHWSPGMKSVIKIDCEGGENSIWEDPASMVALALMDYITIELHFFAQHGGYSSAVRSVTEAGLQRLEATHHCELKHIYFWATKRNL